MNGPIKVQAAVLEEPGTAFRVETLDLEPPRAGEVLVKVAATGVCHSDWHLMTGATQHPLPVVPGPWVRGSAGSPWATTLR